MSDFVTLSCPNCGGKLQVTPDIDRFACSHCGMEQIVKRGGGIISLSPVIDAIAKVQTSVDFIAEDIRLRKEQEAKAQEKIASELRLRREKEAKAQEKIASELAINRLKGEVKQLQTILYPLQDRKKEKSVKNLQLSYKIYVLGIVISIIAAIGISVGIFSASSNCLGWAWIAAIVFAIRAYSTSKKAKVTATAENDITKQISDKQAEIKRYETIVN